MESDEFGPLTTAEGATEGNEIDVIEQLKKEKEVLEAEFGQKRAKFMDLFKQKEDALQTMKNDVDTVTKQNEDLSVEISQLKAELDEVKTVAAISDASKQDEIDDVRRQHHEEIASLQHIMKDAISQAHQNAAGKFEQERAGWTKTLERMEQDQQEMREKLSKEREGFLASVAKTLQKKVGGPPIVGSPNVAQGQTQSEQETLEDSMRKAKEDAEVLRSVVLPLEEEIMSLKERLSDANTRMRELSNKTMHQDETDGDDLNSEIDDKVKELNHCLETEKSSRIDLEMYVAVLNTQKNTAQEESDKLRAQLHDLCRIYEQEKREHNDLKRTWQMANDQFLESQRLMMMDMHRMEDVLSAEQQRQLAELKQLDADREAQEKRVQELELLRQQEQERQQQQQEKQRQEELRQQEQQKHLEDKRPSTDYLDNSTTDTKGSLTSLASIASTDLFKYEDDKSATLPRSQSNQSLMRDLLESGLHDNKSLQEENCSQRTSPDCTHNIPNLTEAQQRAITDPTPESEASQSLLANIKSSVESSLPTVGKRLVSDKEWDKLQRELKTSREKLGKPCDMCNNYEAQLQAVQDGERKAQAQVRTLERQLQAETQAMTNQTEYTQELEKKLHAAADEAKTQISTLMSKIVDSEKFIAGFKHQFAQAQVDMQDRLKCLTEKREEVQKELTRLQEENDSLIGRHSKNSQQMQEECINLPNNLEEMQLLLLKYREEIIQAKVAKEQLEDNLKSEILFLKDQVLAEQQEKSNVEETLSQDVSQLQDEIAVLRGCKIELERQKNLTQQADSKLKETEDQMKTIHNKSKQVIAALQVQVDEAKSSKAQLDTSNHQLKAKVSSLQVDLDNSEAVQRDFVKLSQSLQIQLEKIRSAEHEVRWQHEEDLEECSNCRGEFSVTRRKHHCKHCGRIFCQDCLSKCVNSGPNLRPSRVCDVCHTILVRDATPYFSTDLPHTPD